MIVKDIRELKLDDSGRIYLSAEERRCLGAKVIIRRKGDELIFYSIDEWTQPMKILKGLRGQILRRMNRALFAVKTVQKEIDGQGRIFVPKALRERR